MASPPTSGGQMLSNVTNNSNNVKKCGYLKKQKHGHRRFFVLREPSESFPARLEYYESEKKWKNKSAAKRVILLDSCLCINKRADSKHKHLIAFYTKDEYFAVAAENKQEQESWFRVLSDMIEEGKVYDSPASNSTSLFSFEEANYGMITPTTAFYKEVWQVNLKSRGLGQTKHLIGVFRLCLSSRTISFVKLNSEVAAVSLQLMNIRRCGHSDSFFFIEVGRSAVTGPGELWMQADDSVVAQNIHETILEAMKAMKELSEFRPRSKSQSARTNPISVPTRRNLNNLPPSQTGLVRRSRTNSIVATSPMSKFTSCRIRTANGGDGSMVRPVSMSISMSGSPTSPLSNRIPLSRSNTLSSGRICQILESSLQHSRSLPVSTPQVAVPSASLMSGTLPTPDAVHRPFSCSASISGSLSDASFMLCDENSSSPGDTSRLLPLTRSDTHDSLSSTPSSWEANDLCGYMIMDRTNDQQRACQEEGLTLEKAYRKRTYSLTTPRQQRVPAQLSSASLDEYTLLWAAHHTNSEHHSRNSSISASPKVSYPESNRNNSKADAYMPMSPMCVSAPKQIINPWAQIHQDGGGYRTNSPSSGGSLEDSGYMRMWCSSKSSIESPDSRSTYMNMSPSNAAYTTSQTPPDYFLEQLPGGEPSIYSADSLPRPTKLHQTSKEVGNTDHQYVLMSPQGHQSLGGESDDYYSVMTNAATLNSSVPSAIRQSRGTESLTSHRGRMGRPNRLSLDSFRILPSMNEHLLPGEPRSPGEYINIDFSESTKYSSLSASNESQELSLGSIGSQPRSPLSDYMNLHHIVSHSPKARDTPAGRLDTVPESSLCPCLDGEAVYHLRSKRESKCPQRGKDEYTEMTFGLGMANMPPQFVPQTSASPSAREKSLSLGEQGLPVGIGVFLLGAVNPVDPDRAAKVIRADPNGRRRHSSETFSSTATVTPVFPSFAHGNAKRHSSVENLSMRSSEGSDEECDSPMSRETSAGFQNGLNYIALNLMENWDRDLEGPCCEDLPTVSFKPATSCKGALHGLHVTPYVCLGFKEAATTVKD
ncbi:LOW QUALITY PROTEIN: insulin receptor substrate 2 [Oncorhynchus tshawytscha]|uniref:LOW QUALITY PROTEIN: insulin receptor substrate 2 n=1 Tax=Oncorhynchus tshawytscha TaxID=74940 RepID=UPI001C3E3425|nr:LOW QUALITY PROTEIN: insulin receptor substrate 2 [Oncorhynchus tshawytscha]